MAKDVKCKEVYKGNTLEIDCDINGQEMDDEVNVTYKNTTPISSGLNETSNEISIDRLVNESSIEENVHGNSFGISALKLFREKCLTADICQNPNRDVRMVKSTKKAREISFTKCTIEDAKLYFEEIEEILRNQDSNTFLQKSKKKFLVKQLVEDFIRIGYLTKNNVCNLNFKSIRINKNHTFSAYGYCTDYECNCYLFVGHSNGEIAVFRSQNEVKHCIDKKFHTQCRGVQRYVEQASITESTALIFRDEKVLKQSDKLRRLGKSQGIKSLSNFRNMKSESAAFTDLHPDPFVDTYLMFISEQYSQYIQLLSTKLEVYLWSKKQIEVLRLNNDFLLKKMNYTLHIDATGRVVQGFKFVDKKIFLYSIVGHVEEAHLVFSVVDAIISNHTSYDIRKILNCLHTYCSKNHIKWPLCKRIVTDVSFGIMGAIILEFNNINSIVDYINTCYEFLLSPKRNLPFVCVQFCVSHYTKIICRDIDKVVPLTNVKLRTFLREAIAVPFNLNTLSDCEEWFKQLCIILCTKKNVKKVYEAMMYFKSKLSKLELKDDENEHENEDEFCSSEYVETIGKISEYSRFRIAFATLLPDVDNCENEECEENKFFFPKMAQYCLEKHVPYLSFWSNIIGTYVDNGPSTPPKRVSNGPIETRFKDIKKYVLQGQKLKLGRFVRKMFEYSQSKIKQIKIFYSEIFDTPIAPGTLVKCNKNKAKKAKTVSSTPISPSSKKIVAKIPEVWKHKRLQRLPHKLFNNDFKMLDASINEFQKSQQNHITDLDASVIDFENSQQNNIDDLDASINELQKSTQNNTDDLDFKCNLKLNQSKAIEANKSVLNVIQSKSIVCEQHCLENMNNETKIVLLKQCNNSNRFTEEDPINFWMIKLKSVFTKTHGKHFSLTCYCHIRDIASLQKYNWLTTTVVDAAITCIINKFEHEKYLYIPSQTTDFCFSNSELILSYLKNKQTKTLIPQCYNSHYYIILIDFEQGTLMCLDPQSFEESRRKFITYYMKILKNNFPHINWVSKRVAHDIQKDSWNCGVFVIQFAERFIQSSGFTGLENQDKYRSSIRNMLFDYGEPISSLCFHCLQDTTNLLEYAKCNFCERFICISCIHTYYNANFVYVKNITNFICKLCED